MQNRINVILVVNGQTKLIENSSQVRKPSSPFYLMGQMAHNAVSTGKTLQEKKQ